MPHVLDPHGDTRRFTITLPYLCAQQLGRLQWWWRLAASEENLLGEEGRKARRQREVERFHRHVERWLANTEQRMYGAGPIPEIGPLETPQTGNKSADAEPNIDERRYA
jgi:hypothetical protein